METSTIDSASPFQSLEVRLDHKPEPFKSGAVDHSFNQNPTHDTVPLKNQEDLNKLESVASLQKPEIESAPSPTSDVNPHMFSNGFHLHTASSLYPPLHNIDSSHSLTNVLDTNPDPPSCVLNSYKFNKPRVYVKNDYPYTVKSQVDLLRDTSLLLGSKERPQSYNEYMNALLTFSKKVSSKSKRGSLKKTCVVNSLSIPSGSMKMLDVTIQGIPFQSLIDTGSTHCLISVESFKRLGNQIFTPINMIMKVAGSALKNNIIGSIDLQISIVTDGPKPFVSVLPFLIAHNINNYEIILGADFLLNPLYVMAITPYNIVLFERNETVSASFVSKPHKTKTMLLNNCISTFLPLNTSSEILVKCAFDTPLKNLVKFTPLKSFVNNGLMVTNLMKSQDSSVCRIIVKNVGTCPIKISSDTPLGLLEISIDSFSESVPSENTSSGIGLINGSNPYSSDEALIIPEMFLQCNQNNIEKHSSYSALDFRSELNSKKIKHLSKHESKDRDHEDEYDQPDFTVDIEDEMISQNEIIDPTKLDKKTSYKDCTVNPDLPEEISTHLWNMLRNHKTVFATSKLDVGKFKGFLVQIEIDKPIIPEKQRYMSPEKLAFCKKTFETFEKLNLIQECHTPKTISNLLLVPKYEGLRDLTKASTYLAQVRGEKTYTFRIVQDLRRINLNTKNIRKSQPVLPESIFTRMQNKIVSSIDANQAYWHLVLDNESRPWTAFYLGKKLYQFNRMAQGLMNAPACWDEAMMMIFSPETMNLVKNTMRKSDADRLPDSYDRFFTYYQDDSWIISDNMEIHLIHLEAVIIAYKIHDIKISPDKCTFFAKTLKVLGVQVNPNQAELALDSVKAKSILTWEKPDSLYTLQSRLYSLNYWQKFIPMLSELKFPLNQILKTGIFSWDHQSDEAWERIKSVVALDIKLTIPQKHEQLVLSCDASKVAISCILWVEQNNNLRVVGCYSKLFSHTDSLKSIHFKETYAMVEAFKHYRPYLLNSSKSVIVFTDARSLMWVSRNREYSIACNGLVNKLAQIQLEIPHIVYSVPSEVNYLADLFSRAFQESRFLEKTHFSLSKVQANNIPPLTNPCVLTESELYFYFSSPIPPENMDAHPRIKLKIATPKPIKNLYKMFSKCTPEQKYYSAIRLLQGWNDANIMQTGGSQLNTLEIIESKDRDLYKLLCQRLIDLTMDKLYSDLDKEQSKRMRSTLMENLINMKKEEMMIYLKKSFLEQEHMILNEIETFTDPQFPRVPQAQMYINYSLSPGAKFHPRVCNHEPNIRLPTQENLDFEPAERKIIDTKIRFFIPRNYYGQIKARYSPKHLEISIFPWTLCNDNSLTVKLSIKNTDTESVFINSGTELADLIISPVLHPKLFPISTIEMVVKKGLDSKTCLEPELINDLKIKRLKEAYVLLPPSSKLDMSEISPVKDSSQTSDTSILNSSSVNSPPTHDRLPQKRVWIDFSLSPGAKFNPSLHHNDPNIRIPSQESVILDPSEIRIFDTRLRFFIPRDFLGQIKHHQNQVHDIFVNPIVITNNYSDTLKLTVKNLGRTNLTILKGDYLADLLVIPSLYPKLNKFSELDILTKQGLSSSDCLNRDNLRDLKPAHSWEILQDLYTNYLSPGLDLSELTEVSHLDQTSTVYSSMIELTQVPTYPPDFEKTVKFNLPESSDNLILKHGKLTASHDQKTSKIFYSLADPFSLHPRNAYNSPGIDLPLQETVSLGPSDIRIFDTKIKFFIPSNFVGQISARSSTSKVRIYVFPGIIDNDYTGTIKLVLKNENNTEITLDRGECFAQLLISPTIYPEIVPLKEINISTERGLGSFGSSNPTPVFEINLTKIESPVEIVLKEVETSFLHIIVKDLTPDHFHIPELNLNVLLPSDPDENKTIIRGLKKAEYDLILSSRTQKALPIINNFSPEMVEQCLDEFTKDLIFENKNLKSRYLMESSLLMNIKILTKEEIKIKEEAISHMCQKLALLAVQHIKEQSISKESLSRCQISDDFLSVIYESMRLSNNDFPAFHLTKGILFKRTYDRELKEFKSVICLPDILLASVIHSLHTTLSHPSSSTTLKNFECYYYHRQARRYVKEYVRSCVTCALAGKIDVRKIQVGSERTMKPTGPRQCVYMDLLPFPKGTFTYILLAVDAYSQYIMTVPLKDKTGDSVLQGVLSIFSSMSMYRQVYFDNETSFTKVAKSLVKSMPIEIHYSAPYAHHQNSCEVAVKIFKKSFMKLMHDSENPNGKSDWYTILPAVTQSVNRQMVLSLGMTRESLHFNSPTEFYPLAHITKEAQDELQDCFNTFDKNFYQKLVDERLKRQSYLNRSKVPIFWEGQLVFVKNQLPTPGSTILKLPYKGPLRIKSISPRNVTLVDLETGRDVTAYYEFLKPLSIKEFRLFLSKGYDLNFNNEKRVRTLGSRPILDENLGIMDIQMVQDEERINDNLVMDENDENDGLDDPHPDDDNIVVTPDSESAVPILTTPDSNPEVPSDDPRFDPHESSSFGSIRNVENLYYKISASKKGPLLHCKTLDPNRPLFKHVSPLQNEPSSNVCISLPPFPHGNNKTSSLKKNASLHRTGLNFKRPRAKQDVVVGRYIPKSVTSLPFSRSNEKKAPIAIHEGIFPPFPSDLYFLEQTSNEEAGCEEDHPLSSLKSNLKPIKKVGFKSFLTRFFNTDDD